MAPQSDDFRNEGHYEIVRLLPNSAPAAAFRTNGGAELDSVKSAMHTFANIADDPVFSRTMAELIFDRHVV